jgi:hypothetical protein
MTLAYPKPKEIHRAVIVVRTYRDLREVCMDNKAGRAEYRWRTLEMRTRQKGICCLHAYCPVCPGAMTEEQATFDHEYGRGGGKRDDRIELPDGTWINGACHAVCNVFKGSRYIPYNRSFQK